MSPDSTASEAGPDKMELIRQRAYELWVEEGRPEGRDQEHWERARRLIDEEQRSGKPETAGTVPTAPAFPDPVTPFLDPPVKTKTAAKKKRTYKSTKA